MFPRFTCELGQVEVEVGFAISFDDLVFPNFTQRQEFWYTRMIAGVIVPLR